MFFLSVTIHAILPKTLHTKQPKQKLKCVNRLRQFFLPKSDCPSHGGIAVHDGVDPADELIHTRDLAQMLLCELKDLVDVETNEIIPVDQREGRREQRKGR